MALKGIRVIEMAGLAPAPFCGMILADFGASVVRVDRARALNADRLCRGKESIAVDLKKPEGCSIVRKLCSNADVLIEPFRPGVMERLGLGPKELLGQNKGLIYARLTGYGQQGSLSERAGHDINYLAISGLLSRLGRKDEKPYAPINLLADFAGGGLVCALGIMLALFERTKTGKGQIIDAAMVEGAAYVGSFVYQMLDSPIFTPNKGEGWLDGGGPFYGTYKTRDGKYMAVGSLEVQFYDKLIEGLGIPVEQAGQFHDWEALRQKISDMFATRTQVEWCRIFDDVDACVTPVLTVDEAVNYQHNKDRGTFTPVHPGVERSAPNPAPRLSEHTNHVSNRMPDIGEHSVQILQQLGYTAEQCSKLMEDGVVQGPTSKI